MVMRPDVWGAALDAVVPPHIAPPPLVDEAADRMPVDEISLGDCVPTGGEAAVLIVLEAVTRLLPGVVGNPGSLVEE